MAVTNRDAVESRDLTGSVIADVGVEGSQLMWPLVAGERLLLVESRLERGFYHARHRHPEHETAGYVISGRLQMGIGEEEFMLGPGDAWHHPTGVWHWARALEDTHAISVHSPPRPEYDPRS
jgi:quercetin dioxygenase-like cupin family protein